MKSVHIDPDVHADLMYMTKVVLINLEMHEL